MKFKGTTKPLLKRYDALLTEKEAAFQAVFDAALPRRDIPWQTCYKEYADQTTRDRHDAAWRAVLEFEISMAHDERRGWIENGRFSWY